MDFARMSADAPGVREILFKAQTIIPAVPTKPVWQKAAPVAGAAVLAGALFVPVLPSGSSLDKVSVNYESDIPAAEAQQIQFEVRRELPADILMGSHFRKTEDQDSGRLTLTFSATGEPRLRSKVEGAVRDASAELMPLLRDSREAELNSRESIVQRALSMFSKAEDELSYIDPQNGTAQDLLRNPELVGQGLNSVLSREGYQVASVEYFNGEPVAEEATQDYRILELPSWPLPLRVEMDVNDMASFEHEQLQQISAAWLDSVNLGATSSGLASRPGKLLPIIVDVRNPDGISDPQLSQRLQALVIQPTEAEITDASTWDVQAAVEGPLRELMGNRTCAVAYERVSDPAYNRDVNFFWVHVKLLNQFEKDKKIDERVEKLNDQIDF